MIILKRRYNPILLLPLFAAMKADALPNPVSRTKLLFLFPVALIAALMTGGLATAHWLGNGLPHVTLWQVVTAGSVIATLTLANLALRWLRWQYLCRSRDTFLTARDSLLAWLSILPLSMATPLGIGELGRFWLLRRRYHLSFGTVSRVWVAERATDVLTLSLMIAFAGEMTPAIIVLPLWWIAASVVPQKRWGYMLAGSVIAWSLVAFGLAAAVAILSDGPLPFDAVLSAFASGTLLGGLSVIPFGAGTTGSTIIHQLQAAGIAIGDAALIVLVFRAGTTWLASLLGIAVALMCRTHLQRLYNAAPNDNQQDHFDSMSSEYADQLTDAVIEKLLTRKTAMIEAEIAPFTGKAGLDVGCGHGWYALANAASGAKMVGIDLSAGQIAHAVDNAERDQIPVTFKVASATELPFPDNSFDFAYAVNSLHHITDAGMQRRALEEIVRVLKPGGKFFLHEMNPRNPLFRFYLGYVFPVLKTIDEGTERWLHPECLPSIAGATWAQESKFFTFLPEFLPAPILRLLNPVEAWLERSSAKPFSAHFMAVLKKHPQQ